MTMHNNRGHEWFDYNGDRDRYDLDREWWWDDRTHAYYDDFGNRFLRSALTGKTPEEVSRFMASFPKPETQAHVQEVIDFLADWARKLVAA